MGMLTLMGNPGHVAAGIALAIFLLVVPGISRVFGQSDSPSTPDDPRQVRNNRPTFTASFGVIERTGLPRPVALDIQCRWAADKPASMCCAKLRL